MFYVGRMPSSVLSIPHISEVFNARPPLQPIQVQQRPCCVMAASHLRGALDHRETSPGTAETLGQPAAIRCKLGFVELSGVLHVMKQNDRQPLSTIIDHQASLTIIHYILSKYLVTADHSRG